MSRSFGTLEEWKAYCDEATEALSEGGLCDMLRSVPVLEASSAAPAFDELVAERMAFGFVEDYTDEKTGWGTYFGPMIVAPDETGTWYENPSIRAITPAIIEYWARRAREARHPVLAARYGDLVWEFAPHVEGAKRDPECARLSIRATIEMAARDLYKYDVHVFRKLGRALSLALSLRDDPLAKAVADALIAYENRLAQDDKPGLWGHCFDIFVAEQSSQKVRMSTDVVGEIVDQLEKRLSRVTASQAKNGSDAHVVECIVMRLARYYRQQGRLDDVRRVLTVYEQSLLGLVDAGSAMLAFGWLERAYFAYRDFNLLAEASRLNIVLSQLAERSSAELKPIEVSIPVDKDEVDKALEALTSHDLAYGLRWIATNFVPERDRVVRLVKDMAREAPLQAMINRVQIDDQGRPVARIGSVEEDLEGRVVSQTAQNLQFSAWFVRQAIERFLTKLKPTADDVVDWLHKSPVFDGRQRGTLKRGVEAYLAADWIAATHILIPQIESSLRRLAVGQGAAPYKPHRFGGYLLKNFEELIREPQAESCLGTDVVAYLRTMLTDQRGWNLRNNVCHGTAADGHFSSMVADRVMHALLIFGLIESEPASPESGPETHDDSHR